MKTTLAITLLLFTSSAIRVQTTDQPFEGIKLTWLERRYWNMVSENFASIEKKQAELQAKLDQYTAAPPYPEQQRDIFIQKVDLATHQKTYDEAQEEFSKVKELFVKASADKKARKLLNRELKAALKTQNQRTADENAAYRSTYPSTYPSRFTVRCYSGGVGRYFWVRCTSSVY